MRCRNLLVRIDIFYGSIEVPWETQEVSHPGPGRRIAYEVHDQEVIWPVGEIFLNEQVVTIAHQDPRSDCEIRRVPVGENAVVAPFLVPFNVRKPTVHP